MSSVGKCVLLLAPHVCPINTITTHQFGHGVGVNLFLYKKTGLSGWVENSNKRKKKKKKKTVRTDECVELMMKKKRKKNPAKFGPADPP